MKIDSEYYFQAKNFVRQQTPPYVVITSLPVTYGHTNFRSPAIYVAIPIIPSDDHTECVSALFHEYGHWLDMHRWLFDEGIKGDPRQCALKYNDYLETAGICETPSRSLDKAAVLANERAAWLYGKDGLVIGTRNHRGLKDFNSSLVEGYEAFSQKMLKSYE